MRLLLNKEHWTELALLSSARGGTRVATAVTLQLAAKSVLLTVSPVAPFTNLCCPRHFFARHQVLIRKARGIIFKHPNQPAHRAKVAKIREGDDAVESYRYLTLTALQPLVEHKKDIARSLNRGLQKAERIASLEKSNIRIAWKTPKNLGSVFADSNRKSLVQLK